MEKQMAKRRITEADAKSWSWLPAKGYGPFRFGMLLKEVLKEYEVMESPVPISDGDVSIMYRVVNGGLSLDFEEGRLRDIHLMRSFRVDGRELVGMAASALAHVTQLGKLDRDGSASGEDYWLDNEKLGLRLCIEDGHLTSAILYEV